MPKVLNIYKDTITDDCIYIGRPSKWGNPFIIGKDGNRYEVIEKYRKWIMTQPDKLSEIVDELCGKDLSCYCSPKACHGDILLEIANKDVDKFDWLD